MGLDSVELLMNVEAHFGLEIPDADASAMQTVGDLHAYIVRHAQPTPSPDASWEWLRSMIAEEFGVDLRRVVPTATIVQDLGIN